MNRVFPIFVGSGRSGTTLFRNIFDAHPELAMSHEAHFIAPMAKRRTAYEPASGFAIEAFVADLYANPNFRRLELDEAVVREALGADRPLTTADAIRSVMASYADRESKPLYGDKTPGYVIHLELLGTVFPEAKFVHIIRDGRDVALAYVDRDEWGPSSVADAAHNWKSRVGRGRKAGTRLGPERYREVRYEDMVEDPEAMTQQLCAFLGLEFDPAMLRYHEKAEAFIASTHDPAAFGNLAKPITKGIRDWRRQMGPDDVALCEAIAGDLLADLGYEVTGVRATPAVRMRAASAATAWQGKRVVSRVLPVWNGVRSRLTKLRR